MTGDPDTQLGGGSADGGERTTDMEALLEEGLDYQTVERGKIIEGVVMGWDRDGVIVDVGSKSEGIVPRNEMHSLGADPQSKLPAGEKVLVAVVQSETGEGQIMLSIDRARGERGWRVLQERFESGESFEGDVTGYNKGGLLVNVEGVNAFVPMSQIVGVRPARDRDQGDGNALAEQVGRQLRLKVIEINRRRNRVILSERAALQEWRLQQKERLIEELREGDIRRGRISSVRNFGVFVDLGGADGLAHLSELSWERNKTPGELFNVGDEVDVYVTKIDSENKKIALSLRRANPAKWDEIVDKYAEGRVVSALVTKLVAFGAFARVEGPVEGLIHVSELVDRRIGHPKEVVREGDLLPVKIVRIERDRHRLGLSLRRAREEGELMGFVFSDGGEVLSVPDDIREEFEAREGPLPTPRPAADTSEEAPGDASEAAAPASDEVAPAAAAVDGVAPAEAPAAPDEPAEERALAAAPAAEEPEVPATDDTPGAQATEFDDAQPAAMTETPAVEELAATAAEAPAAEEPTATAAEAPDAEEPTATPAEGPQSEETAHAVAEAPSVEESAPETPDTTEEPQSEETAQAVAEAPSVEESAPEALDTTEEPADQAPAEASTAEDEDKQEPIATDSSATPQEQEERTSL